MKESSNTVARRMIYNHPTSGSLETPEEASRQDKRFWNDERTSELIHLTNEGLSATEIAEKLDTSRGAIVGKWNRLGLSSKWKSHAIVRGVKKTPKGASLREKFKDELGSGVDLEPLGEENQLADPGFCKWLGMSLDTGPWKCCNRPTGDNKSPYCEFHTAKAVSGK